MERFKGSDVATQRQIKDRNYATLLYLVRQARGNGPGQRFFFGANPLSGADKEKNV